MKSLVFKEIWILSKAEKAGINLSLSSGLNLLIGENDVGKSTLIKSLYHCLGADTPQINNSVWKKANPIYCVKFEVSGIAYHVVRDEKYFGVFDGVKRLISRHVGVSGPGGVAQFINGLLDFDIELERQVNGKLGVAGPAFYFLPFYVDQDEGWSTSWSSFVGLQQFSNYRKLMLEYHLGVRPQSYYDSKKRELELSEKLVSIQNQRFPLQTARNSIEKRKRHTQVELNPAEFQAELEVLVDQWNDVYSEQQQVLLRLKDVRNQRNAVSTELDILTRGISELEADYSYSEAPETPNTIGCPTCGTEFCNSFVERFGILDDIDHCYSLKDQWQKKHNDLSTELHKIEDEYQQVSARLSEAETTLARTKQNVTLSEIIASEGMKEMISILNADIQELLDQEQVVNAEITENAPGLKIDGARKKNIVTWYKARMKEYLNTLNVGVLSENDYKTLDKQIRNNALGSDLPRALLAQYFALISTMNEFNSFVLCPMLIDSPFQQEQDLTNRKAILDFIVSKKLNDQQMILATISIDEFTDNIHLQGATLHTLDHKLALLDKGSYQSVLADVGKMHGETLSPSS